MRHDPTKLLLGGSGSNIKTITCEEGDPAVFKAGLAVRKATTGALQLPDNSTASLIGISMGPSLSDTKKTAVARVGQQIPIVLKPQLATLTQEDLTFTSKLWGTLGNDITVALVDTQTGNVADVTVTGTDIVVAIEAGVTTNTTIKTAIDNDADASSLVTVAIATGEGAATPAAFAEDALEGGDDVAVVGTVVKIDDTSGEASFDGDNSGAVYLSGPLTGVYMDGSEVYAAYVAMPGGL